MRNLIRTKTQRIHFAQLFVLISLGAIFAQLAQNLWSHLHAGIGSWTWENLPLMLIMFSGFDYLLFGASLVLFGIAMVYLADAHHERDHVQPLQNLLTCAEAAASGDLSRTPPQGLNGEIGQLAHAIGRMITVLERSENLVYHLSALVESSSEAIISFTLDGTIMSWNKGAQRIYGYSIEEAKGKSLALISPIDQGAELKQYLENIRLGERVQPFETLHQARNGRTVRAFVRVSAILDSTRNVIGASYCAQDLTDTTLLQPKPAEEIRKV